MDDLKKLIEGLHPLERAVLPHIRPGITLQELAHASKLQVVEVDRAAQWLENKEMVSRKSDIKEMVKIGKTGSLYVTAKLPERRMLESLAKPVAIKELPNVTGLSAEECNVSMGLLKSKGFITLEQGKALRTKVGEQALKGEWEEETLLKSLHTSPRSLQGFTQDQQLIINALKKRKDLVELFLDKTVTVTLTAVGKKLSEQRFSSEKVLDRLTPEHLKLGHWKDAKFRRYDVKINVPRTSFGRKQHYRAFLDTVREKFASLGFTEMSGPIVESEFWDMDALFMPQFHSARDIHEAYYIKEPQQAKLDLSIVEKVKQSHETGYGTGSKGWRYAFDQKITQRTILRTQGTALSARMLASKDLKVPGKYFGITKCFRYDVIDATHLPDFYQTEGIVLDEGLTLSHLKGVLRMFAEEFAETDQIKLRPAYFPFTEPSCELFAKHPELGWIELGGAGIFRPELTKPLGVDVPVIAWGIGIDRVGMFKMGLKDIRDLYSHDLEFLKYTKVI